MKSAALQTARARRVTCVLAAIEDVLVFSLAHSRNRYRPNQWRPRPAVGLLTTPEEEIWECLVSW
jgi:hypothetical protein